MSLSQRDRLAFRSLLDHEPTETRDKTVALFQKVKSKTSAGSGHEISGVLGNEAALAALSLFLVLDAQDPGAEGLEARLQRASTVSLSTFRSAVQSLRQLFNMPSGSPSRPKRTPRKSAGTTTPVTTPTKRSAPSGSTGKGKSRAKTTPSARDADVEQEDEVIVPRRTPRVAPGSRTKGSSAVNDLMKPSPVKSVNFALDEDDQRRGNGSKSSSPRKRLEVDTGDIETPPPTPTKRPRVGPSSKERVAPPPCPPEPTSIFGGRGYSPPPSKATEWEEAPWHIDYDDMLWCMDPDEETERGKVAKEWDEWKTAKLLKQTGWQRPSLATN